ncbi:MAG: 2-iminoacetate synthase ThiH [Verrucomicrobiota bacterium]|nr:2-iminoacetate synthase ThiH [Verrucomicrobiota bacterium]
MSEISHNTGVSFVDRFHQLPLRSWHEACLNRPSEEVLKAIEGTVPGIRRFLALISPAAEGHLEAICHCSRSITQQRFGKVIRLFAPLYVSNECINNCSYCGFSRDNPILRVTLKPDEVIREAKALLDQGFRNILLVAGEHPKFVSTGYMEACLRELRNRVPGLSLEVGPMETEEYRPLVKAGAEGLVVYQETYDSSVYQAMHTAGPKKDFDWRLETPERGYRAGFRRLGIGALFGLADWRSEAIALAVHAQHLLKTCWKAQITISFPRLRPCAGSFEPLTQLSDIHLVQLVAAFRICFPDVGLVLSTRESASLRNGLMPLGITLMSAGSHTEPGGYTGAGKENIHQTLQGRIVKLSDEDDSPQEDLQATGQFDIADERSPEEMAQQIRELGYEPVWKDWDTAILG